MGTQGGFIGKSTLAILAVVAAVAAWAAYSASLLDQQAKKQLVDRTVSNVFSNMASSASLDELYRDSDGDLVADTPDEVALLAKPNELVFSFIASEDSANDASVWQAVTKAISDKTGLPVTYLRFDDSRKQLAALRGGQLHISAFSSGTVPLAVNSAGFVPFCTIGSAAKEDTADSPADNNSSPFGYTMQFIVKANSPIQNLDDLREKKIAFVRPRSNSGCKAALILLLEQHGLQLERDYRWYYSFGHNKSIQAVLAGEADAAPVASDVLARLVAKGEIETDAFRVIYESERFPPFAFGCSYNLPQDLRDSIRAALLNLDWTGTKLSGEMGAGETKKFLSIDYKNDWANIRRVNRAASKIQSQAITH